MEPKHKDLLTNHWSDFVNDLQVGEIIPFLIEKRILTSNDAEFINSHGTTRDKNFEFMCIIKRKGPKAFSEFRDSLKTTHVHLSELLECDKMSDAKAKGLFEMLSEELRDYYSARLCDVSPLPWCDGFQLRLDKVYTSLKLVRTGKARSFRKEREKKQDTGDYTRDIHSIFKSHKDSSSPRRILVEGEPGIGKSTLCCKLAYDWCNGTLPNRTVMNDNTGFETIHNFNLVFLLKAREFGETQNVFDAILDQLLPDDTKVTTGVLQTIIEEKQEKVLWIIDGYDELSLKNEFLENLIQRKVLSKGCVLLTTRPSYALNLLQFIDTLYINIGYDDQQKEEFIRKFAAETGHEDVEYGHMNALLQKNRAIGEVGRNPLNLSILCMLYAHHPGDLPQSRTALYKELTEFMIKRASSRLGVDESEVTQYLPVLCKLSFLALKSHRYSFSEQELKSSNCNANSLLQLGFFTKEINIHRGRQLSNYAFTHKSFQEFFAAQHIASLPPETRKSTFRSLLNDSTYLMTCIFIFGHLRHYEESLVEFLAILREETFSKTSFMAFHQLGILDVANSHRSHAMCQCLCELSDTIESEALCDAILKGVVGSFCFSFPRCTPECVQGFIKVCDIMSKPRYPIRQDARYSCYGMAETAWHVSHEGYTEEGIFPVNVVIPANFIDSEYSDDYARLFRRLQQCQCIKSIALFNVSKVSEITQMLSALKFNKNANKIKPTLKVKCMGPIDWDPQLEKACQLESCVNGIELYSCSNPAVVHTFLKCIPTHSHIRQVSLHHCAINGDSCRELMSKMCTWDHLTRFDLLHHGLHISSPSVFCELLTQLSKLTCLHRFKLSDIPTGKDADQYVNSALKTILSNNPISSIHISNTKLTESMVKTITSSVEGTSQVQKIQVSSCQLMSPNSLNPLLKECCTFPNLQSLIFRFTELGESNLTMIGKILKSTKSLKALALSPIISNIVNNICEGLKENTSIECLILGKISFENDSMERFARAIENHGSLTHLELSLHPGHYFVDVGIQCLVNALKSCSKLSNVALRHFGIEDNHLDLICDLLLSNPSIVHLDLHHNKLSAIGLERLYSTLCKRPKLMCLDVSDCDLTTSSPVLCRLKERVLCLKMNLF